MSRKFLFFLLFLMLAGLWTCGRFRTDGTHRLLVAHTDPQWMQPYEEGFHGFAVMDAGWDMRVCAKCHGADLEGDKDNSSCRLCHTQKDLDPSEMPHERPGSCLDCHKDSPRACNTCHGNSRNPAPPRSVLGKTKRTYIGVGAHQSHVQASQFDRGFLCTECHAEPAAGHYNTPLPAKVVFGPSATGYGMFKPKWNRKTGTCANVMCHGWDPKESKLMKVKWNSPLPITVKCGDCHSLPPAKTPDGSPHVKNKKCVLCHKAVVDDDLHIIDPALHVNGRFDGNGGAK